MIFSRIANALQSTYLSGLLSLASVGLGSGCTFQVSGLGSVDSAVPMDASPDTLSDAADGGTLSDSAVPMDALPDASPDAGPILAAPTLDLPSNNFVAQRPWLYLAFNDPTPPMGLSITRHRLCRSAAPFLGLTDCDTLEDTALDPHHVLDLPMAGVTQYWRVSACSGAAPQDCSPNSVSRAFTVRDDRSAMYEFEGNANDATGNGHDGTFVGSVTTAAGLNGFSLRLSGLNTSYVTVPDAMDLDLGAGDFTISIFLQPTATGAFQVLVGKQNSMSGYALYRRPTGAMSFSGFTGCGLSSPGPVAEGGWHHVAVTRNGTTLRMYVDGAMVASALGCSENLASTAAMAIGCDSPAMGCTQPAHGWFDNLTFFRVALNDEQIDNLFRAVMARGGF